MTNKRAQSILKITENKLLGNEIKEIQKKLSIVDNNLLNLKNDDLDKYAKQKYNLIILLLLVNFYTCLLMFLKHVYVLMPY